MCVKLEVSKNVLVLLSLLGEFRFSLAKEMFAFGVLICLKAFWSNLPLLFGTVLVIECFFFSFVWMLKNLQTLVLCAVGYV